MGRLSLNSHRTDVKPLPEKEAVELGSDIIGEIIIYTIAATILTREYIDNSTKAAAKEEKLSKELAELRQSIDALRGSLATTTAWMESAAPRIEGVEERLEKLVRPH